MSRICPECSSRWMDEGYGMAAGGMGTYVVCANCDTLLYYKADVEGLSPEDAAEAEARNIDIGGTAG